MAFLDSQLASKNDLPPLKVPAPGSASKWYNVHANVGPQRFIAYRKDDVLLVQLFISQIAKNPFWVYPKFPQPSEALEVDGVFGRITKTWIEWYQGSRDLTPDGQVSFAPSGQTAGKKYYTIVSLNSEFAAVDVNWHYNLSQDPRTPPELRYALQKGP